MSRDSSRTHLHLHSAHHADLFEDFCRTRLPPDLVAVAPQHEPPNPEDEDDVVPHQHAAFGIQRATQAKREPAWRDLGLEEVMRRGPERDAGAGGARGGGGGSGGSGGSGGIGGGAGEAPVGVTLRLRRAGLPR